MDEPTARASLEEVIVDFRRKSEYDIDFDEVLTNFDRLNSSRGRVATHQQLKR